jgi:flavin reductase (DIM6/NTAB) family NADH-FMN oxidoreductase RutF
MTTDDSGDQTSPEATSSQGTSFEAASFETVADLLDYPMVVVTTAAAAAEGPDAADGGPDAAMAGCLVGFTSQVSINPARFLVGLSNKNYTFRVAEQATHLVVHVLGKQDRAVARLFGEQTGDQTDKFAHCSWRRGPGGAPILDQVAGWFSGRILERIPIGDHMGFLLEPSGGQVRRSPSNVITLNDVRDLHPGHEP